MPPIEIFPNHGTICVEIFSSDYSFFSYSEELLVKQLKFAHSYVHTLLMGMENGKATAGNSIALSYKTEHVHTIQSSHYTLRHLSWGNEKNVFTQNLIYMKGHGSFICKSQNLVTTQMSVSR